MQDTGIKQRYASTYDLIKETNAMIEELIIAQISPEKCSQSAIDAVISQLFDAMDLAIIQFKTNNFDFDTLSSFFLKIKKLNASFQGKNELIHTIYQEALKNLHALLPEGEPPVADPPSNLSEEKNLLPTSASAIFWPFNRLSNTLRLGVSMFYDYFVDGNHPWKMRKYELGLSCINKAFCDQPVWMTILDLNQIEKEKQSDLQQKTLNTLKALLGNTEIILNTPRDRYKHFLSTLSIALKSSSFEEEMAKKECRIEYDPCVDFLLSICLFRYTEVHIYSYGHQLITEVLYQGFHCIYENKFQKPFHGLPNDTLKEPLMLQFEAIRAAPQSWKSPKSHVKQRVQGMLNLGFVPQHESNLPYVLYDLIWQKNENHQCTIRVLRMATPTSQRDEYSKLTWEGEAEILPEFINFIRYLGHNNQKMLFLSLQYKHTSEACDESKRNLALIQLSEKYPQNFHLCILDQDSDFYYQQKIYSDEEEADHFKETFFTLLKGEKESAFHFPNGWLTGEPFRDALKGLLDKVHQDIFENKKLLSVLEKQDFIEIYNLLLILYLLQYCEPNYLINCCRDSVDRGNKSNVLLFKVLSVLLNQEEREDRLEQFCVFTHLAAFLVKKQEMNFRRERLMTALDRLLSPPIREKVRSWKEIFPVVDVQIQMNPDQRF